MTGAQECYLSTLVAPGAVRLLFFSITCGRLFCEPMDCSPPNLTPSIYGISQARILEWVAISFSRVSSQPRDQIHVSCIGRKILHHQGSPSGQVPAPFQAIRLPKSQETLGQVRGTGGIPLLYKVFWGLSVLNLNPISSI